MSQEDKIKKLTLDLFKLPDVINLTPRPHPRASRSQPIGDEEAETTRTLIGSFKNNM